MLRHLLHLWTPSVRRASLCEERNIDSCLLAYLLNLRGSDIPYRSTFHSYLFVSLDTAVLFVEGEKLDALSRRYLELIGVQQRSYTAIWTFIRNGEWGEGKVRNPNTSLLKQFVDTSLHFLDFSLSSDAVCYYTLAQFFAIHHCTIFCGANEIIRWRTT